MNVKSETMRILNQRKLADDLQHRGSVVRSEQYFVTLQKASCWRLVLLVWWLGCFLLVGMLSGAPELRGRSQETIERSQKTIDLSRECLDAAICRDLWLRESFERAC